MAYRTAQEFRDLVSRSKQIMTACLLAVMVAFGCGAVVMAAPPELEALKSENQEDRKLENEAFDSVSRASLLAYSEALRNAEDLLKKNGDLDHWVAVRREQERLSQAKEMPQTPDDALPQFLKRVHAVNAARTEQARKTQIKNLSGIARKYLVNLESLKKRFASDDRIDDALLVQAEIKLADADVTMRSQLSSKDAAGEVSGNKSPPGGSREDSLLLHYSFDTVAKAGIPDVASGKYPARIVGKAARVPGRFGKAIRLEPGSHLLIPAFPLAGATEFTVSVVVKDDMAVQAEHGEAYVSWGDTEQGGWVGIGQMRQRTLCFSGGSRGIDIPLQDEWRGKFTAYCLVCRGGQLICYVDGVQKGVAAVQSTQLSSGNGGIGTHWWAGGKGTSSRFRGDVDDVRVYRRALAPGEIKAMYAAAGDR